MNKSIINNEQWVLLRHVFNALEFAAYYHRNQKRKGAENIPYINHPIEVANLLASTLKSCSETLLIAALLHDTLEDTDATEEDISLHFGNEVLELILEVSDNMNLSSAERKKLQIQKAMDLTVQASALKIADKTCNIRDIITTRINWSRKRKIEYITWAKKVVNQLDGAHTELMIEFNNAVQEASKALNCSIHEF